MLTAALVSALLLASPPRSHEASGRVLGEDGKPIAGAQVCEVVQGQAENCVATDDQGAYRIAETHRPRLQIRAKGFVWSVVDAAPLAAPVKLVRAASLLVTVVDAQTKKPISEGRVMLDTSSGRRVGDFMPFNKAGVRIATLDPGLIFVRAEADGYLKAGPTPVELVGGSERAVTIPMTKYTKKPR